MTNEHEKDIMLGQEKGVEKQDEGSRIVTVKSVGFSLVVVLLSTLVLKNNIVGKGPRLPEVWVLPSAFPFFFLLVFSLLSKWIGRRVALLRLNRGELALVYIVSGFGVMILGEGHFLQFLFALILGRFRQLSDPGNQLFYSAIARWNDIAFPSEQNVIFEFFAGSAPVRWTAWVIPIILWTAFFAAIVFLFSVLAYIFYQRWSERERLTFAVTTPILWVADMDRQNDGGYDYKNRLFLLGGLIPIVLEGLIILNRYYPTVPVMNQTIDLGAIFSDTTFEAIGFWPGFFFRFMPSAIGLGYIIPTDVSMSVWVFYLLQRCIGLVLHMSGVLDLTNPTVASNITQTHGWGAVIGLSLLYIWFGRQSIVVFFTTAFKGSACKEDGNNRVWMIGTIICLVFVVAVLRIITGLTWLPIPFYLVALLVFALAWARARAESAVPFSQVDMFIGQTASVLFGAKNLGYSNIVALNILGNQSMWTLPTTTAWVMEAMKIGETVKARDRAKIVGMILGAFVVSLLIGAVVLLPAIYDYGGFMVSIMNSAAGIGFVLDEPIKGTMTALTIGGIITLIVGVLRSIFTWWPISPIGYAMAAQIGIAYRFPGSFFLAWLVKSLVTRCGGRELFVKLVPFFVGMIVFDVGLKGLGSVIDIIVNMVV